jgi:hypothetical protein
MRFHLDLTPATKQLRLNVQVNMHPASTRFPFDFRGTDTVPDKLTQTCIDWI